MTRRENQRIQLQSSAVEQPDAADGRGASDGRPPLIWVLGGPRADMKRQRVRVAAMAFLVTLAIVWLPWVAGFAIDIYLLGHVDPKLGRDAFFLFGVMIKGVAGVTSAVVATGVHLVETLYPEPIAWRSRQHSVFIGAVVLSALTPIVPYVYVLIMGFAEIPAQVIPWAVVSLLCTQSVLVGAHWMARHSRVRAAQQLDAPDERRDASMDAARR